MSLERLEGRESRHLDWLAAAPSVAENLPCTFRITCHKWDYWMVRFVFFRTFDFLRNCSFALSKGDACGTYNIDVTQSGQASIVAHLPRLIRK
jgi:hypothetical protein